MLGRRSNTPIDGGDLLIGVLEYKLQWGSGRQHVQPLLIVVVVSPTSADGVGIATPQGSSV